MPRRSVVARRPGEADRVLGPPQETVLDVLDHLLNKGVMATGDVTLGVAGIDLVYLRLSTLLCATDRIMPTRSASAARRKRKPRLGMRSRS